MSYNDKLIVRQVAYLVEEAQARCPLYASAVSPLHQSQVLDILRQCGCYVHFFAFQSNRGAFAHPFRDRVVVSINANASHAQRELGPRHELEHVLAGEVMEAVFMNEEEHYMSAGERMADLFALADLIPTWALKLCDSASDVEDEVRQGVAEYEDAWPAGWGEDRAALRSRLFHEYGI